MVKLYEAGRNLSEILLMFKSDIRKMKYQGVGLTFELNKHKSSQVKKRPLYLSSEVIQKTKILGQNQKSMVFTQIAQRVSKISNPMLALVQKENRLVHQASTPFLQVNNRSLAPQLDGDDTPTKDSEYGLPRAKEAEGLSQMESIIKMRRQLGKSMSLLSRFKSKLTGTLGLKSS